MDSSNAIYCYLHIEGGLVRGEHGNMEYREGRQQGICVDQPMTYNDFVSRVCGKMSTNVVGPTFSYSPT